MSYALENKYFIKPRGSSWDENPLYEFDNSQIVLNSPKGVFSSDIIGNELAVDQFSFTVRYDATGRQLYIFNNDPKLAYIFSGYVPGSFESLVGRSTGWRAYLDSNKVNVSGNTVVFEASRAVTLIMPGYPVHSDVVRIGIEVLELSDYVYIDSYGSMLVPSYATCTILSETGLFEVQRELFIHGAKATTTGRDILTFKNLDNGYREIHFKTYINERNAQPTNRTATIRITGIEFNGKMLYGSLYGNVEEADPPPQVYLFRPKYDASRFLADLKFGDPVYWAVGENVFAKGYIKEIERTGRYAWKVTCVSGVGLLDQKVSVGGIYTGQPFSTVFAEIVGDTITYAIDADVAAVKIFGWLPYEGSARNNLHRLLFATGAALVRHNVSSDGNDLDYDVKFPGKVIRVVPSDHVALSGSVKLNIPADGVEVTEHAWSALQSDEEVQLYDNTLPEIAEADHLTVTFSEPMHDLNAGGFTIHESGVNYAIISGTGILTGKKYTHTETVYPLGNPLGTIVKRIVSNGLITFANSLNVARRVLNYFQSAKAVKAKLMLDDANGAQSVEKPGETLQMTDAWGESISAYMSKQEVGVTSIFGASVELVDGYTPTGGGNNYQRYKFFKRNTAVKTFTVTAGISTVRAVLLQAGAGGQGGEDGHDGWGGYPPSFGDPEDGQMMGVGAVADPPYYPVPSDHGILEVHSYIYGEGRQYAFDGGRAGEPGANGKILVITKDVEEGDVITFTQIGVGGTGGSARANGASGGLGAAGTHTTVKCERNGVEIWSASSEDGAAVPSGFLEAFTNQVFGLPGEAGHDGGKGGTSDAHDLKFANTGARGNSGGDVGSWSAGAPGRGVVVDAGFGFHQGTNNTASGGGSGGAAWGANGGPGKNATYEKYRNDDETWVYNVTTGTGGDGADAVAPEKPTYGQGGTGGNGGGSGGNNGGGVVNWMNASGGGVRGASLFIGVRDAYHLSTVFNGGKGGKGSKGGTGGDGLGILYY